MKKKITIIDYGMGNIESLKNSIDKIGYDSIFYSENNLIKSNIIIIPGVGAFNRASELLLKKKINEKIIQFSNDKNNIVIGICLGMQLLLEVGMENGKHQGLGLIKGNVDILSKDAGIRLPNVGWLKTDISQKGNFGFLSKFNEEKFYYIHSFKADPLNKIERVGHAYFNNSKFCSIASNNHNVIGTQFHPEKSGEIGLEFLKTIIKHF
jgi:glutamine amidotransferase